MFGVKHEKIEILLNKKFVLGLILFIPIIVSAIIGPLTVDRNNMLIGTFKQDMPPSINNYLGTDTQGRDIASVLVAGLGESIKLGFLAASISLLLGIFVGIAGGYIGGTIGNILKTVTDTTLIIPSWPILVTLACYYPTQMSIPLLATLLAVFNWPWSARIYRSQVLSLKKRLFIDFAKLNNMGGVEIAFKEVLPNLLPYVGSTAAFSVLNIILTEIGLEVIGVLHGRPTIGGMVYWATTTGAFGKGMWWWIFPPIICLLLLFLSLMLLNLGLDEIYNPRLRKK